VNNQEVHVVRNTLHSLLILMLFTCSALAQVPEWAKTNQHKKYPSSRFLLGVGLGKDKSAAVEAARADVARQIQVRIESELENVESEFRDGDRSYLKAEIVNRTKTVVTETIAGLEIAETQEIKGQYYVLAVLNREKYLSGLEVQMEEVLQRTGQLVSGARELVQAGKVFGALTNYLDAQGVIPEFYTKSALYTALSGRKYPNVEQFTGAGILAESRAVLSNITLQNLAGNDQQCRAGEVLPQPLRVQVVYEGGTAPVGVAGFPLTVRYASGEQILRRETDAQGMLEFTAVATPTDNIGQMGAIRVGLELQKVPEHLRDIVSRAEVVFSYSILKVKLAFAVTVVDQNNARQSAIEEDLVRAINENGFSVDPQAPYLVAGQVIVLNQKEIPTPSGKQFLVETRLQLNLKDTVSQKTLATVEATGKGLDLQTLDGAINKAFRNTKIPRNRLAAFLQSAAAGK